MRHLLRRVLGRPEPPVKPVDDNFWYRSTKFVMRRSIPIGIAIIALLLLLGAPFLGARWGFPDDRVLPQSLSAREVGDQMRNDFAVDSARGVTVVIPDAAGVTPQDLGGYAAALSRVSGVPSVSSPTGTFVDGAPAGPPSAATGLKDGSAFLTVGSNAPLFSDASEAQLDQLRAVSTPAGKPVQLTGVAQINRDSSTGDHRPTSPRAGGDRCDHLRAAVPADRQRDPSAESLGAQCVVVDGGVRRAGVDIPGGPPRRAWHHADRNPGRQHAGAVVLHRVRPVHGLRGLPRQPDPGVLAVIAWQDPCGQRRGRRARAGPHRPRRHRGCCW